MENEPGRRAWSAAEIVAHLIMVERAIIANADRIVQKTPKRVAMLKRFHLPMAFVEARLVRRKTPIPLDPELVREKEAMLAGLREVRERTLAFIDETRARDLSAYRWPHPFLGSLNMYSWLHMIAAYEIRDEKQMRKIVTCYRKM